MINSARKGLSYAAMLVMFAASVAVADHAPVGAAGWQKGQPKRVQLNARQARQKFPQ